MTENDYEIARELKELLAVHFDLIDFRVFGSRARGDAENEADMDVFIEVESLTPELKEKIHESTWLVGFKNFIVISPLIVSRFELEQTSLRSSAIILNIMREGVSV